MASKKRGRRTASRRKTARHVRRAKVSAPKFSNIKGRIARVVNNLLLFIALSLVSFVLYRFVQNDFLTDLFFVMSTVFGFIAVGFFIALLILEIVKYVSKKR